jgi:hypothetical protein
MPLAQLPQSFVSSVTSLAFADAAAINGHFQQKFGQEFPAWFRANCGGRGAWRDRNIPASAATSFAQTWNNTRQIFGGPASFFQFACLASIIINETGGSFTPISERYGRRGHPGIAYLFDAIAGVKQSYNKAPNVPAGKLFNDRDFIAAHGDLAPAQRLKNTSDARWNGQAYPQGEFPTSDKPNETGFIMEADFFKFRGRGLIQTTWRAAYLKLVTFVQRYTGDNPTIHTFKVVWRDMDAEKVASVSRNADWDQLFQKTDLIVACEAIRQHSAGSGRYLELAADAPTLNLVKGTRGTIFNVGLRVSGSADYATLFRQRVLQICEAMMA